MAFGEKTITFIRHGKPQALELYTPLRMLSCSEIVKFINAYDIGDLSPECEIPEILKDKISKGDYFISSNLKRTKDSFERLGVNRFESSTMFNEAQLPHGMGNFIKLPLVLWLIILRMLWIFGYNRNSETYKDFIGRIKECSEYLEKKMVEHNHIVVMAHGFVNRTLIKELNRKKWSVIIKSGGHKYWSFTTMVKKNMN